MSRWSHNDDDGYGHGDDESDSYDNDCRSDDDGDDLI